MHHRQRSWRAAAAVLLPVLAAAGLGGCSSPTVKVTSSYREQAAADLAAIYVMVGDESKIDPAGKDAITFVRTLPRESFKELVQFRPRIDERKNLSWEIVDRVPKREESLLKIDVDPATRLSPDPLVVKIASELSESSPELAMLVVAQFNGADPDHRVVNKLQVAEKQTVLLDVRDKKLNQLR
jgi:hypothetical protein